MPDPLTAVWIVAGIVLGIVLTLVAARIARRSLLGKARRERDQLISNTEREAAATIKEANTAIKEQRIELRAQLEQEGHKFFTLLAAFLLEKRILAKEENIDKRLESLDRKANELSSKERELNERDKQLAKYKEELQEIIARQTEHLENISGMSADEAKRALFTQLENEVRRDTAVRLKRIEDELVENADKKAKWIVGQAIQRCAADHVAESSVSVVPLPNDEMKGRIIGREGRNIRALESSTGINIIIDDTPEAVILSGFDPVRREIARITLERLIQDGRIHPARIEEVVAKVQEEMNQTIRELGEQVCLEADVHGLHPEIVKLLGRLN